MLRPVYPETDSPHKTPPTAEIVERRRQASIAATRALLVSICQQQSELADQEAAAIRRLAELEAIEAFHADGLEVPDCEPHHAA